MNWFELDMSNHPPWQAVPLLSQSWLLPSGPSALSQPSWVYPHPIAFFTRTQDPGPERSTDFHLGHSATTNWGQLSSSDSACSFVVILLVLLSSPRAFLVWNLVGWKARLEWGGKDRDCCPDWKHWVIAIPGTGPHCSALGPRGLLGNAGLGRPIYLMVQAEFRVPDAADLRTELSFPRQKMGRGAGSVETPKALLATPLNSQSST